MIEKYTRRMISQVGRRLNLEVTPELSERVADEQVLMVWNHALAGTILATVFALSLAAYLYPSVGHDTVLAWVFLKLFIAVPRVAQAQIYRWKGYPGGPSWRMGTYLLLAIDGVVWGLAGAWLIDGNHTLALMIITCLSCVACVATFGLQVSFPATVAYAGPIVGMTAASLLALGSEFGVFLGSAMLILLGVLLSTSYRWERRITETFLLRFYAAKNAQDREDALEMALRQSAVKGQFLTTMSHELRTPLHGILGLAKLIQQNSADAGTPRRAELIQSSGSHLLSLINSLLDMSSIESGKLKFVPREFDLRHELDEVAEMYAERALDKGLTFTSELALPTPCWVVGDPGRLRQVLHNLCGNAIKFTERGSVRLVVTQRDAKTIRFAVVDTGIGIASNDQARVFESFEQATWSKSRSFEGTGLGLTISREIARMMGGDVTCSSELGVGSTFTFEAHLPVVQPSISAQETAQLRTDDRASIRKILLAEDNDVNAIVAEAFIQSSGMTCERVVDGRKAVESALREINRPQLILMDCMMPSMDGFEATRLIRQAERSLGLPRVPVIALTASSNEENRDACRAAGMDGLLPKPFTSQQLAKVIARWMPDGDTGIEAGLVSGYVNL